LLKYTAADSGGIENIIIELKVSSGITAGTGCKINSVFLKTS